MDWKPDDTKRALKAISEQKSVDGQVYLFIDGLDECDGGAMKTDDIDFIVNLQNWKAISIRPELPIQLRLDKFSKLFMQQWTSGDIAAYVSKELGNSFKLAYPQATPTSYSVILAYLTDTLVQKAEGVFLWVKLVVKELQTGVESYVRDEDLKVCLELLPKGIDDLYSAIFAKILPKDLHHAINYIEALSESTGLMTLHDMSFIDEGPQVTLDRSFASIPIEERIERCRKMKGRVVRCTRNLLEFRENHSQIQNGYLIGRQRDLLSDNEKPGNENSEDKFRNVRHVGGILGDETADLVSHEGQLTKSPGGPSTSLSVHEPLLQMEVRFVHRTLQEYMKRATVWELIVQRAFKNILIDPHLSMLACTFSKVKTCPYDWSMPRNSSMTDNISAINGYIKESENSNITHSIFLESMFTGFKNRFSNWTEFWNFPADWGCGVQCVLARGPFELHLREAFEQKRVDNRYLPHLLTHYSMSYHSIEGSETFQLLLRNGCRVGDQFLGRSAWEFLLWETCRVSDFSNIDGELEVCRISLENGADPNLFIQPITVDHFPLDLLSDVDDEVKKTQVAVLSTACDHRVAHYQPGESSYPIPNNQEVLRVRSKA